MAFHADHSASGVTLRPLGKVCMCCEQQCLSSCSLTGIMRSATTCTCSEGTLSLHAFVMWEIFAIFVAFFLIVYAYRRVIMERVRVRQLVWGSNVHKEAIQQAVGLFDVILGADVVYTAEAISSLFTTLQALLCPKADAMALLCYIVRRVSEKFLQESANAHGLQVLDLSPELTVAAKQVSEQDLFQFMLLKRKQ